MASKQPLKNDSTLPEDDFDFDANFDFDEPSGGKRDPGSPIKRGVKEALRNHFTRPEDYRKYVGKVLPRQYGELWDDYTEVSDSVKDAADSLRQQARQPINDLAKALSKRIDKKNTRVHGWLNKVKDATEDYKLESQNTEKLRQEATRLAVAEVFSGYQERQDEDNKAREEIESERFARQYVKIQSQERLLAGIAKAADHQTRFITGIELPYRKRSLELQYRMAHGITDIVTLTRGLVEQQRRQLDLVIKNTALPEVQKQQLSENFKQNLRNKFVDKTLGGLSGGDFFKNLTKNVTDTVKMAADGIFMGAGFLSDMDDDPFDSSPEARKRAMASRITESVLSHAGPAAAGKLSRTAMRRMPKTTRAVFKGARQIGYLRNNAQSILSDYANGDITGKDAMLRDMLGLVLPGADKEANINRVSGRKLLQGTHFDHASRRSIVEVIPGYLAKILQELQITRTGDTSIKALSYNFSKSSFESQATAGGALRAVMAKNNKSEQLNEIIADIERSGVEFTPEQRKELAKTLLSSRRSGRTMVQRNLMNERFFKTGGVVASDENAAKYADAFRKYFDANENGRFTGSHKGIRARNQFFEKLASTDNDEVNMREALQDMFDTGQGAAAYESGLMSDDGRINIQALYDTIAGDAPMPAGAGDVAENNRGRRRRRVQTGVMMDPMPTVSRRVDAPELRSPATWSDQHLKVLEQQQELTRLFYVRNHEDLTAVLDQLRVGIPVGDATLGGRGSAGPAGKPSWKDRFSNLFKRNTGEGETPEGKWRGYWHSSVKEGLSHFRERAGARAATLGSMAMGGLRSIKGGLSTLKDAAVDKLSKSRLVGARYLQDFKDGIPHVGDLYVQGRDKVRITAAMFESGELLTKEGKPILSLADLAEYVGDLYDRSGNIVLTQAEKMRSYVRADGEIFTRVWMNRVMRAAGRVKEVGIFAGNKTIQGLRAGLNLGGRASKIAGDFARELFLPPKDVYVAGEKEPRLLAHLMRIGSYFNVVDGSAISRPTQIKGAVRDAEGNQLITDADYHRGLVDVNGKPFVKIIQRAATAIRNNIQRAKTFGAKAIRGAAKAARTTGRFASTFLTQGLNGIRAGGWRNPKVDNLASGVASNDTNALLVQIRDILDERLQDSGRVWSKPNAGSEQPVNINAPGQAPEPTSYSSSPNVLGSVGSAVGGLAASAVKGLAALTRRGKSAWTTALGGVASDASQEPSEDKAQEEKKEQAKEKAKEKSLFTRLSRMWKKPEPTGQRVAGDKDGNGLRDGSGEDIRANWKNINLPTKTLDDVKMPEARERKNTIDTIVGAITGGFKAIGGLLSNLGGLGGLVKGAGKLLGGAGRMGRWGLTKALPLAAKAGRFLGSGLGGAAARAGALKAAGGLAGKVAGFGARKLIMGGLGAVGGVLGSPVVGTALAIGGAIWTAKEIYDYFQDKKNPVAKSDKRMLDLLRMAEYGAPMKDYGAHNRLRQMESMLESAVKISDGKAELNKSDIDATALLGMAAIPQSDTNKVSKFLDWFNNRFTPVYLKWMTVSRAVGKPLVALEDLSYADRIKILQATADSTGWDVTTNPFGSEDLAIGSKEIGYMRDSLLKDYEGKKSKGGDKDTIKESLTPKEGVKATLGNLREQMTDPQQANRTFSEKIAPAMEKGSAGSRLATFSSEGAKRPVSSGLTPLQSIRMRLYGFTEVSMPAVTSIRELEALVRPQIRVDSDGVASFSGDIVEVFQSAAKYFGVSPGNPEAQTVWSTWFFERFLPVYTTFVGQVSFQAGLPTETTLERQASSVVLYAIAQAMVGIPGIWKVAAMPTANEIANADATSVDAFMAILKEQADKQKVDERAVKPAAQTQQQQKTQGQNATQTPTREFPSNGQMRTMYTAPGQKTPQMPNTMPDVETEPKVAGSAINGAVKAPPTVGSLVHAPGELAAGTNGMKYVKAPSPQAIEGLNPEVKRLFLAMAEEYGEQTQQSIQVNRGFVTRAEQAEQYSRTPNKAAPPGSSLHEFGLALDINSVDANRLEKLGLMRKYGFTRPVGGETWHIEPAGIQHDVRGLRTDPAAAAQAVAASVGRGGGGVGATKTGFRLGGRDTAYALRVRDGSSQELKPDAGGFAGSVVAQRGGTMTVAANSGGVGGAPMGAANDSLYSKMPVAQTRDDARALVQQSAQAVGVDPQVAMTTVAMESGFRPGAKAGTSSATGLYQFTKGTWGDMMKRYAKDYGIPADTSSDDPRANAILGAKYLQVNMGKAKSAGLPEDITSAYMMHFMGPAGGRKALGLDDDAVMAQVFPEQATANRTMFYNDDGSPRTKGQFMDHIRDKINKAARDFGISDNLVASPGAPSANQPMFKPRPMPNVALRNPSAPLASAFEQQTVPDRAMRTAPAVPKNEAQMLALLQDNTSILGEQLNVQKSILEQMVTLVTMAKASAEQASATATAPAAPAAPSRAERSMRQVSAPAYLTRSA